MVLGIRFMAIYPEDITHSNSERQKKYIKIMEEKNEQIVW